MENISTNITYGEATKSQEAARKGIDNTPDSEQLRSMIIVAHKCFEPLRRFHNKPIGVSSFFRSIKLNNSIGGSDTSDHCKGKAIDIDADIFNNGMTNLEMFNWLRDNTDYDQLIKEYPDESGNPKWVHISYRSPSKNRKQVLVAEKIGKRTIYKVA